MRCPYCQTPIRPDAPECPACMLTYPRTATLVGAMPRITPLVSDTTGQLKAGASRKIARRLQSLRRRFPQLTPQVVMHAFPVEHPFTMHAFWLFNAGAFAGELKRGKNNHALLILVDPFRQETAIVPGYGLESLLNQEALDHLLAMSGPAFQSGKWLLGFEVLLDGLEQLLETVSSVSESLYSEGDF